MISVHELPPRHPTRQKVALQIRNARREDRNKIYNKGDGGWENNRSGALYIDGLEGLANLFRYVKDNVSSKVVLDIGTGSSRGISRISRSTIGEGLEFKATALTIHPDTEKNLGLKNITLTSSETLRGFETNSIGCILGLFSIAYSADMPSTVARINQILVPGGVIKARFDQIHNPQAYIGMKTTAEFVQLLTNLDYDISNEGGIVIAIKPTKNKPEQPLVQACVLRKEDAWSAEKQVEPFWEQAD